MAKMMTQLQILTKHVMGECLKAVNIVASKAYENEEETKKMDEEIQYLANYSGGSCPAYQR